MDKFILTIEASVNAAGGGAPVLDIIVDGIPVTSSAAITSVTGVGSDILVFTLDFTGSFPTSLAFRFNGGSGDPGDVVSLDRVRINGHALAPGDLTGILIAQGATRSVVSTASIDHLFARVEPTLPDLGTVTHTGTAGDDADLRGDATDDVIDGDAGNDRILGFDGDDAIYGGDGDDVMFGENGNDILVGGLGNDRLSGNAGDDLLFGGDDNDVLLGEDGNDVLSGGNGDDNLTGGNGDDIMYGDAGNDRLMDTAGNNVMYGGAGNDILIGGIDNDTMYGGDDNDQLNGGKGDDYLSGDAGDDTLAGGLGVDTVLGGAGNDLLSGGAGADVIDGGADNDTISLASGDFAAGESITGGGGADTIKLANAQTVDFTIGTLATLETLTGSGGNDITTLAAAQWAMFSTINLGGGTDRVNVQFDSGATDISGAGATTVTAESSYVIGTASDDSVTLTGTQLNNMIIGAGTIDLGAGTSDTIILTSTSTTLNGLANGSLLNTEIISVSGSPTITINLTNQSEGFTINGGGGADTITGGSGNDTIEGGAGNDTLNGNGGTDTLTYVNAGGGITISLASGAAQATGGAGTDTISNFENLTGSAFADNLTGTTGANVISGLAGNDTITAGDGADTIDGGDGDDTIRIANGDFDAGESITGGAGADTIVFTNATTVNFTTGTITGVETLTAFAGNDTITMSATQWAGFSTIDMVSGTDVLNVVASGDISASGVPATLSNIDTGNLTGTGGSDTVTLTGAQLDAILIGAGTINLGAGAADTINLTSTSADLNAIANGSLTNTEIISAAAAAAGVTITLNNQSEGFTITGSDFNDTIRGGTGADTINAGAGDDSVEGNTGNDTLNGGTGTDTVTYANAAAAVTVNLSILTAQNTVNAGTDTLSGFENLTGSAFNDVLTGDAGANVLSGGNGNDTLAGRGGNDTLDGGAGTDTATYASAAGAVTASLLAGSASDDGDGGSDTLISIENLTGSSYDDSLTGDANANILSGGAGSDTLYGGGGNDTLYAGIATSQILSDNPGVVYYDGSFYKLSAAQAQYAAAETAAESSYLVGLTDPGYLVTITSAGEDAFVQAIVDASDKVWIGARDVAANNNWQWVGGPEEGVVFFVGTKDSGTSFGYEGFEPGNAPDGSKDFAYMEKTKTEWFSETGTNNFYYITEWRAGTSGGGDTNTLNGGAGADQLYASDDIDIFVFDNNADAFTNPDTVNNFNESGGDAIDISDILSGLGVNAGNLSQFVDIAAGTGVRIDVTGSGSFGAGTTVAAFAGTTTVSNEAVLLANSQLII